MGEGKTAADLLQAVVDAADEWVFGKGRWSNDETGEECSLGRLFHVATGQVYDGSQLWVGETLRARQRLDQVAAEQYPCPLAVQHNCKATGASIRVNDTPGVTKEDMVRLFEKAAQL